MPEKCRTQLPEAGDDNECMSPFNKPSRSTLCPLVMTRSLEYQRGREEARRYGLVLASPAAVRERRAADPIRMAEAPFRVMNQRRRLQAFYWSKADTGSRGLIRTPRARSYGAVRGTWLLSEAAL
jgi:hypothetical protein